MGAMATGVYGAHAATIALWNFNSPISDTNVATGTTAPAIGIGTATLVGGVTATFTAPNGGSDPSPDADNSNWRITTWPAQGAQNRQNGVRFNVPTFGCQNIRLSWDLRNSNTASKYTLLQYTTNGTDFVDFQVVTMPNETWINGQSASFAGVPGVENNPNFGVRFVTEFESTALGSGINGYVPSLPGGTYGTAGTLRFDMVHFFADDSTVGSISVLTYNIFGSGESGWTLASANVQAVGRQLAHLQPDIIGFQEVPEDFRVQMTNFIGSYLPGYYVAIGSSTGGSERSAVASRYPIVRSKSWLVNQDLTAFGYNGDFTRDLFEAQIAIPGFPQPFHCFVTHLKATIDGDSATRRGAEARCISNFFVTAYQTTNSLHPCVLVGDMNEDVYEPRTGEQQAIQTMTSASTGIRLADPRNLVTGDDDTWSARNTNPSIRFDYVLPNYILASNMIGGQVFRSDTVSPPAPPLLATDSATASDHYPVLLVFNNPYDPPPFISAFAHQTILVNTSTTNIALTIRDLQTNPTNLLVSVYSAHPTLVPPSAITLGGSGASRTLQLTPAADAAGASWITVSVSDGASSASNSFMLKVLRPQIITLWDFNSNPPDNNTSTGTLLPAIGAGTAASVGTATNSLNSNVSPVSFDPNLTDNSKWRMGQFPAQGTGNKTSGAEFRVSTVGHRNIALSWDHYNSATGSRFWRLQHSVNGINFTDTSFVYTNPVEVTWFPTGFSLAGIPGVDNNPSFAVRLVSEWQSTATGQGANQYIGTQADGGYSVNGTLWLDMVTFSADPIPPVLAIRRVGDDVELSWPASATGFGLQSTLALSPANWQAVGQSPMLVNGTNYVTISALDDNRFFRLAY